jgi:hypothetical protein
MEPNWNQSQTTKFSKQNHSGGIAKKTPKSERIKNLTVVIPVKMKGVSLGAISADWVECLPFQVVRL